MPISRRELYLDHGRVFIEVPRLMTDREISSSSNEARARTRKESSEMKAKRRVIMPNKVWRVLGNL
jgi:hypothetical protein